MSYIEINKKQIIKNIENIKRKMKNKKICAVLKDNAYGLGIKSIYNIIKNHIDYVAVSKVSDLKKVKINKPIIMLVPLNKQDLNESLKYNIEYCVSSLEYLKILIKILKKENKFAQIHLKINTGMNRFGFSENNLKKALKIIKNCENIEIIGVFSHLLASFDKKTSKKQLIKFKKIINKYNLQNYDLHLSNSGGINISKEFEFSFIRLGVGLYKNTIKFHSEILEIQNVKKGEFVGYNKNFIAFENMKIAVVNVGYSSGLFNSPYKDLYFTIKNTKVKVIGDVCMDVCFVDITNVKNVKIFDKVTIFRDFESFSKFFNVCPHNVLTNLSCI